MTIGLLFIFLYITDNSNLSVWTDRKHISFITDSFGQITASSLCLYIKLTGNKRNYVNRLLSYDYIQFIKKHTWKEYPFSFRKCSNRSNQELSAGIEYCLLTNIYYYSASDQYYFYQNSSHIQIITNTIELDISYSELRLNVVNDITR